MDPTTFVQSPVTVLSGLVIIIGLLGVMLPGMPGVLICWLGVLAWAILGENLGSGRWAVLGVAGVVTALGLVAKYALPGRNLKRAGVPTRSLFAGGLLGIIGFFVVPVVGLFLGFVLGIWLAERTRLGPAGGAWQSTRRALGAVGLSMMIELAAALIVTVIWLIGLATV